MAAEGWERTQRNESPWRKLWRWVGPTNEFRYSYFEDVIDRRGLTVSLTKRARWSAHRHEHGSMYLAIVAVVASALLHRAIGHNLGLFLPGLELTAGVPFAYMWMRAFSPRFAHDRINRQFQKILQKMRDCDDISSGQLRTRVGNPARIEQLHVRGLRALLTRAAYTVPDQFVRISGRGHQHGDLLIRDKLRAYFLQCTDYAPQPDRLRGREELRDTLAAIIVAMFQPDPNESIRPTVRAMPATPSAVATPLKTWKWRWYTANKALVVAVVAIPVLGFAIAQLGRIATPVGITIAGGITAVQAALSYFSGRSPQSKE